MTPEKALEKKLTQMTLKEQHLEYQLSDLRQEIERTERALKILRGAE